MNLINGDIIINKPTIADIESALRNMNDQDPLALEADDGVHFTQALSDADGKYLVETFDVGDAALIKSNDWVDFETAKDQFDTFLKGERVFNEYSPQQETTAAVKQLSDSAKRRREFQKVLFTDEPFRERFVRRVVLAKLQENDLLFFDKNSLAPYSSPTTTQSYLRKALAYRLFMLVAITIFNLLYIVLGVVTLAAGILGSPEGWLFAGQIGSILFSALAFWMYWMQAGGTRWMICNLFSERTPKQIDKK